MTIRTGLGSKHQEYVRTAEMLVELASRSDMGVYYAVALLFDSQYDQTDLRALLPILEKTRGAIKHGH